MIKEKIKLKIEDERPTEKHESAWWTQIMRMYIYSPTVIK